MKALLLALTGSIFAILPAFAQGGWVNSIADLGYAEPERIGSYYQQGGAFFAVFSCVPGRRALSVEMGFPGQTRPEFVTEQVFLQADGVNFFPGLQNTIEQGFPQAYPKPGLAVAPWAGQELLAEKLYSEATLRVMAIGAEPNAVAHELARFPGNSAAPEVQTRLQACLREEPVESPVAQAGPAQADGPNDASPDAAPERRIGRWLVWKPEGNSISLAMRTGKPDDWDDLTISCAPNAAYTMQLYTDGGPGGVFRDPNTWVETLVDGRPFHAPFDKVEPYALTGHIPAMLLGALRGGQQASFNISNGMKLSYPLDGFGEAFALVSQSCENGLDGVQAWRSDPGFVSLYEYIDDQVREICASSGMSYEVLPEAFQPVAGKPGQVELNYGHVACIGDGWPTFGAGNCGASKCEHRVYQIEGAGFRELEVFLR